MSAVPAWKRLGLKLKGASSDGSPAATISHPTTTTTSAPPPGRFAHHPQRSNFNADGQYGTPAFNKRKQFQSGSYPASDNKRPRWDDSDFTPSKKSVSFSQDTKKAAPKKPKPAKKKKKASKPQPASQTHDLTPSLEYLRTWHKARDAWKFNKNHQTLLLKYMYKAEALPAADIDTFYLYISDIKGGSRTRLIEQAEELRKKDMEAGPKGFPEGTKGAEEKQGQYEEMLAGLLKQKNEAKDSGGSNAAPKRTFDEVEFTLRTVDKDVHQRLVKRMRAELVIDTLNSSSSEDDTGAPSAASTANTTSSRVKIPVQTGASAKANGTEGTKQKAKRRKKLRTADSSSSESESSSDSDSDSSSDDSTGGADNAGDSSSSSSESDSDEGSGTANGHANSETTSSSSSSSESDSESDSESESDAAIAEDEEDTSGSDGDSESSDSDDDD